MRSHYLFSSSRPSAALALAPAPPLRTRLAGDNGEGEDGGSGAGKEGDGEVEGEGDQLGQIFLTNRPAEGLDPGQLDPLEDHPRRPRRPGRRRADPL